jgi:two-component system LytT family sensor kinase
MTGPTSYRAAAGRVIASLWIAAIIYVVALSALVVRNGGTQVAIGAPLVQQISLLLIWAVATPGIIWLADRIPFERRRWLAPLLAHGAIATAFIVALNIAGPTLAWLATGRSAAYASVLRYGFVEFIRAFHLALIVYAFILGAGHYLRTLDIRRREQLRAERLRADLASAQLRALTLQLQPHFLFNALNAVGALIITERNREAFEVVGRLGELLRALLAIDRREEVSLREELELAEAYVAIEQARLGDRLRVTWDVAGDVTSAQLPPMLLQPLIENAVRHGVSKAPAGGSLTIHATREGTRLALDIRDDGPGPSNARSSDDARSSGLGLDNTRRRLAHLYGDDHAIVLSRDAGWTRVHVELPYHVLANTTPTEGSAEEAA